MTMVMNQILDAQINEPEVKEEMENEPEEPPETTMVLLDCAPMLRLEEEDPTKEIQLSAINVTTRSKGPIIDEKLLLPKIRKIQESMNKISSNTQTPPILDLVITRKDSPAISKPMKVAESKMETNKKIFSTDDEMGNDIIEDSKETKENISFFEMCNLPQQRKKLLESFDS